jgi:multidrug efflux pump subunit AcrA (membrane-fusion protein)
VQSLLRPLGKAFQGGLQIAFRIDQEVGRNDNWLAVDDALPNLHISGPPVAELDLARFEAPLPLVDEDVLLERNAIEGMRAQPGGVLFRIADHSVVWALIDVAERDLGAISIGQPATVKARSFPGREFLGKVNVIYPEINKETRTARVRVDLPNPDFALLHDMYIDAEIDTGSGEPVLSVPESAVMDTGSRQATRRAPRR